MRVRRVTTKEESPHHSVKEKVSAGFKGLISDYCASAVLFLKRRKRGKEGRKERKKGGGLKKGINKGKRRKRRTRKDR